MRAAHPARARVRTLPRGREPAARARRQTGAGEPVRRGLVHGRVRAILSPKMREVAVKGVGKRTTVGNVFSLLWAAEWGLEKVREAESRGTLTTGVANLAGGPGTDGWTDVVRECLLQARKGIDECLARESEACFGSLRVMGTILHD
ncbi:hypothetical protein D9619_012498 [Psilocybe cf. subviscida]|uniref:Uncharacterized protein n=1 Tax=Psilocybe cf. subviscida TaxID=2480587 RepID=A0A8H5ARG0_9AGAR|nr:hypothetical protein D9619_012498 [Psilocybe cf. subviscida]